MKKNTLLLRLAVLFGFLSHKSFSQQSYATIEKNVNKRASSLHHDLNKTGDTLLLKSDKKINYVYSINKDSKREVYNFINGNCHEIPLTHLTEGKHTFVVGQSSLKIVFVVRINKNTEISSTLTASKNQ
ncbi:hypothetical protein D7030_12715 [Flavobacteriaceae bacterium AU392]|nr:hypothetical protein D1817_05775 [Flavobacteriaceae bacterium]RKM81170.1 hypothetical protein D7030_12715 [Flavobacteriaceae bacterium AU392]